jgi:hypothetical protein
MRPRSGAHKGLRARRSPRPANSIAHRTTVRFVSDAAKTAKTKGFISPNETKHFVFAGHKSLKSLRAANQLFREIVCFQWVKRRFVSRFSRMRFLRLKKPEKGRGSRRVGQLPQFRSLYRYFCFAQDIVLDLFRTWAHERHRRAPSSWPSPAGEKERYGQGSGNSGEEGPAQPCPARGEPQPVSVNLKKGRGRRRWTLTTDV